MKYVVIAMRPMLGALVSCADSEATSWDVMHPGTGHWIARCSRRVDAEAIVNGQWAVDRLAKQTAEAERCRSAACAALGTDELTLTAAIAALLEARAVDLQRLIAVGRALDLELGDVGGHGPLGTADLLFAQAVLDQVRGVAA